MIIRIAHFFINELGDEVAPRDDTFGSTAARAGMGRAAFRRLIEENAPAIPNGDRQ